jgi:phage shock protein A
MPHKQERANDSLALRSAYARHRHWVERLASAKSIGNEELAREAARFVAEYEDFIAELESQTDVQAIATASVPSR